LSEGYYRSDISEIATLEYATCFPTYLLLDTLKSDGFFQSTALASRIGINYAIIFFHGVLAHVQGARLNHANFASEEMICFRLGVKDGQKCPLKDSNVVAIMLTTPCRISGDHPSLTLFVHILLPWVSLLLHIGWDTALFAGKCPMFV
jgi:hypothetical protein